MANLVIVESVEKVKSIKKYLGKNYDVVASKGHIRDLPKSTLGIDIENDFEPKYINIRGKAPLINDLKKKAAKANKILLATDPDREGEAISWHLAYLLGIDEKEKARITFNEVTKEAVKEAVKNPRTINLDLVDAQQARRMLDRIVGYKLSPFLWKKIKRGLSAGRVQSVATKMIVDREKEINDFIPKEYHLIEANLENNDKKSFIANFYGKEKKKIEINTQQECDKILKDLDGAKYIITDIIKSKKKRNPAPPFTTSTLQQDSLRKLNFSSTKTMKVAQELYESIDIKGVGSLGLITYMRTDSVRIADSERLKAKDFIIETYGSEYYPQTPRIYKTKNSAQDAHEAIRPTTINLTPNSIKESLTKDQFKLYKLIYERFMASQMESMVLDSTKVKIKANDYLFTATGSVVDFKGFSILYEEGKDEKEAKEPKLPKLNVDEELKLLSLKGEKKFTQPPLRYTEATLIKTLDENGIGRPSTYAPTIGTIMKRGYVTKEKKYLVPTPLGEVTIALIAEHFKDIVNEKFTAQMEENLDNVEKGDVYFKEILRDFYEPFEKSLVVAEEKLGDVNMKVPDEESDVVCDKCGRKMVYKMAKYGKFLACPGFPECRNTMTITVKTEGKCPKCGKDILERKSRKGKIFYSCEGYPDCDFVSWDKPTGNDCPSCGSGLFQKGKQKKEYCINENCDFERVYEK